MNFLREKILLRTFSIWHGKKGNNELRKNIKNQKGSTAKINYSKMINSSKKKESRKGLEHFFKFNYGCVKRRIQRTQNTSPLER